MEEGLVGRQNAGMCHIQFFGGLGDHVLIDSLVSKQCPGMLTQVVGSGANPGSKVGVVGLDERGGAISNDGIDNGYLDGLEFMVVPVFGTLGEEAMARVDQGCVEGIEVLAACQGSRSDSGIIRALTCHKAVATVVPLGDGCHWIFKVIVLIKVVLEGGGGCGNNVEGVNFFAI
jgi:hypothetical protein